jgi:hypothetical protein
MDKVICFGLGVLVGVLVAPKKGSDTINEAKEVFQEKREYIISKLENSKFNVSDIDELEESFYKAKDEFVELKQDIEDEEK